MAVDIGFYFATREVAQRCGKISNRYVIQDGRFVLDNSDLANIRLTSEEFLNGLQGVEGVDKDTAMEAIRKNGYKMGDEEGVAPIESDVAEVNESVSGENEEQAPLSENEEIENSQDEGEYEVDNQSLQNEGEQEKENQETEENTEE